jgi:hypothetical protein
VNLATGARCEYIGVGEEVGVHIDELLVGVGDALWAVGRPRSRCH